MYQKIDEITNETPVTFLTVGQLLSILNKSEKSGQSLAKVPMPEIFGLETVCELTGYSKATIYAKTSRNEIPHFKRDNKLFFRKTDVIEWITANPVLTNVEHSRLMDDKLIKKSRRARI
ncbi:MAG TPA: helix-turn-helix domain-containing protein [Prolixibacteraceae bacterium]|nr:helix-turn-helix domain-containing protein [Prolixibacteraceae bacterium]